MVADSSIQQVVHLLASSQNPSVLTGSGASRESGIPTFRDAADGIWKNYDPFKLATVSAFYENPNLVWDFLEMYRGKVRAAEPNPGHQALAQLEQTDFPNLPVITQNIDDLHERAGSGNVLHLHGKLMENRCSQYCQGLWLPLPDNAIDWSTDERPPHCPYCQSFVRPNIVLFGEYLPSDTLRRVEEIVNCTDLMLIIGTSGVVTPAAEMPLIAKAAGATLVEINPYPSQLTPLVDLWLAEPAGEVLPRIVQALGQSSAN